MALLFFLLSKFYQYRHTRYQRTLYQVYIPVCFKSDYYSVDRFCDVECERTSEARLSSICVAFALFVQPYLASPMGGVR